MFTPKAYRAHEALVAPARKTAQIWRLVIGLILVAGTVLLTSQVMNQTLANLIGRSNYASLTGADGSTSRLSVLYLLTTFGLLIVGVVVALRVAHHRGFPALLGERRLFVRQFGAVLTMLVTINVTILLLPPWNMGSPLQSNVSFGSWLLVLPFAIVAILVQVSAEEIFFRGYLQQQVAARFSSPLLWIAVPSGFFAWAHYAPQAAGGNAILFVVWAGAFGVAMADLTARAGTLGPAIAVHFANNALVILFFATPDNMSALALYIMSIDLSDTDTLHALFPVEFMMILVSWLGARLAIRR